MSSSHKTTALILFIAIIGMLVAYKLGGYLTSVLTAVLVIGVVWLTKPLWAPDKESPIKISLAAITSVAAAILEHHLAPESFSKNLLSKLMHHEPSSTAVSTVDHFTDIAVMIFTLLGVYGVNRLFADRTAMKAHPRKLSADFPEQTYEQRLSRLAIVLAQRLVFLDAETQWDDDFFSPLEAEVEINTSSSRRKRLVDLMRALKSENNAQIILVLGDPGAGKSVALRKLAKDLLGEVHSTGRLPVYVNLKEWASTKQWSQIDPPTVAELTAFVLSKLGGISVPADEFLDEYFYKMLERGRFFFILDSFDEIPAVLDTGEASWLISSLSQIFAEFFISQNSGRGVISSRFYRRPKIPGTRVATLEIRPFSDARIYEALTRSKKLSKTTVDDLFTSRSELVPVARNPFAAALLRMYAESNGGNLPANQIKMYESYVDARLRASKQKMFEYGVTAEDVLAGATEIAWAMFGTRDIGLEAPLRTLEGLLPHVKVPAVAVVLKYSILGRMSESVDAKFSFVHRRISEYFVARHLMQFPGFVATESIPTDSRYRDALALYCEIGATNNVELIADFCWAEITRIEHIGDAATNNDRLISVHCLRFLRDAFGTRLDALKARGELAKYILGKICPADDLLAAKLALEATGLIESHDANEVFVAAIDSGNSWLADASLRACRNIKDIDDDLESKLQAYLDTFGLFQVLERSDEIGFSLSLSHAFDELHHFWKIRVFEVRLLAVSFCVYTLMEPIYAIMMSLFFATLVGIMGQPSRRVESLLRLQLSVLMLAFFLQTQLPMARKILSSSSATSPGWFHLGTRMHHVHPWIAMTLYVLLAATTFPWLEWIKYPKKRKSVFHLLGLAAFAVFVPFFVEDILPWLQARAPLLMRILWIGYIVLIASGLIWGLLSGISSLRNWLHDRSYFKQIKNVTVVTRESIARDFVSFMGAKYRQRYVGWLATLPVPPRDSWPHSRPNIDADRSSTLLAQLDEKWLGLDS